MFPNVPNNSYMQNRLRAADCTPFLTSRAALRGSAALVLIHLQVQKLLVIGPQAGFLRAEGGQLAQVRAGEVVALDDGGAVGADGHIPAHMAHLRNFQGSLAGQGLGLLNHGQLITHQGDAGVGVLVKDVEIVVGGGGADLAGVDIHPAEDAPP